MTSFQILNKTGWFSKPARTVENRYGVSVGDSSVGLQFRKGSFYVFSGSFNKFGSSIRPIFNVNR